MKKISTLIFFILLGTLMHAQSPETLINEGDSLLNKKDYKLAFEKYYSAVIRYKGEHKKTAYDKLINLNVKMDSLINEGKIALEKVTKLSESFYFYKDRYALAYRFDSNSRKHVFYFVDPNFEKVEKEQKHKHEWETAEPFRPEGLAEGLAKVSRNDIDYIIDTFFVEYPVSYRLSGVNSKIEAVYLDFYNSDSLSALLPFKENLTLLVLIKKDVGNISNAVLSDIMQLTKLKNLQLNKCRFDSLPASLGQLENLKILSLKENNLPYLPANIGDLKNLSYLNLARNAKINLPDEINNLNNLTYLNLFENKLDSLPDIGNLKKLETLYLTGNNLGKWPVQINSLTALKTLTLGGNNLKTVPNEIGHLKNLEKLILSKNNLKKLPDSIVALINLRELYLSSNDLKELPDLFKKLKNLSVLDLSNNKQLPAEAVLKVLGQVMPESIKYLKNLRILNLKRNTKWTDEEKEKLKDLLPDCEIIF